MVNYELLNWNTDNAVGAATVSDFSQNPRNKEKFERI